MAKKKKQDSEQTGKAEPMTYEVRHVMPVRRQVLTAIETGEDEVDLESESVKSVTITNVEPAKEG